MIHRTSEEIRIMLYLIGYGIFYLSTYDLVMILIKNSKRIIKIISSILYGIIIVYLTYEFSYVLASGYIPVHFILFITLGFILYLFYLRKSFLQGINVLIRVFQKIKKPIIRIIIFLIYPRETTKFLKKPVIMIKNTILNFITGLFPKNAKKSK